MQNKHTTLGKYVAQSEDGSLWVVSGDPRDFAMGIIRSGMKMKVLLVPEEEIVSEIPRVGGNIHGRFWSPSYMPFYWVVPPAEGQPTNPNNESA